MAVKLPESIASVLYELSGDLGFPVSDVGGLMLVQALNEVRERTGQLPLPVPEYLAGAVRESLLSVEGPTQDPLPAERGESLAS
ncbi:hypothetical protein ACQCX5_06940 [Propionibacteriaceae bacterium G57]|uniref:hypothetical protein n=1 Tax=Aestuariimicrobium sp. G57 TaxID=3418485 RepID=UPI003DA6D816